VNIAIITGASSGIGKEFAIQLDRTNGYDEIWLVARRENRLIELSQNLSTPTKIFPIDLEKHDSLNLLEQTIAEQKVAISTVVCAAGFGLNGDFCELNRSEQLQMIDLNCRSIVELTHICIPNMPYGSRFFMISSIAGAAPLGAFALYGASKSFLTSFSVAIAPELKPLGIDMTIVTPGSVETEFQNRSRGKDGRKKKLFAQKSSAEQVVNNALIDAKKGKLFSMYGIQARLAILVGKILSPYQSARLAYTKIYPKK